MRHQFTLRAIVVLTGLCVGAGPAVAQDQDQTQTQQEGQGAVPAKLPRVVGQPQTKEEFDAWSVIEKTEDFKEKAQLNLEFLQNHPESGLTPLAHQFLALAYQQENNYEKFVEHGEKAIAELPNSYVLLIELAVGYAERGNVEKSLDRGQQGLDMITVATKPDKLTAVEFVSKKGGLEADAHYALGLSNLHMSAKGGATKAEHLETSRGHLVKATELDPNHERAYLRLGRVYLGQKDANNALDAYARAVAVEGMAQEIAQGTLEQLYTFVHKKKEGIDDTVAEAKDYLNQKNAEKEARLQEIQEQEAQQLTQPGATPATTEPTDEPFTIPE